MHCQLCQSASPSGTQRTIVVPSVVLIGYAYIMQEDYWDVLQKQKKNNQKGLLGKAFKKS